MKHDTRISAQFRISDWKRVLDEQGQIHDWPRAIEIYSDRIEKRFFEPLGALIKCDNSEPDINKRYYGFVIMAISCLLVETFARFRKGTIGGNDKTNGHIKGFLNNQIELRDFVIGRRADIFCDHFRNGILHQAEIKGDSLVKSDDNEPLVREQGSGICVNRTKFFDAMQRYHQRYVSELLEGQDKILRDNFTRGMNHYCRIRKQANTYDRK